MIDSNQSTENQQKKKKNKRILITEPDSDMIKKFNIYSLFYYIRILFLNRYLSYGICYNKVYIIFPFKVTIFLDVENLFLF